MIHFWLFWIRMLHWKKRKNRCYHQAFMSKTPRIAIMKRSKLRNAFSKKRSSENYQIGKWQRNICSNILKSTKKTFLETLNINEITDNRKFWKTVKPFFTDECKTSNNMLLTKKETHNDNKKIPTTLTSTLQILPKV